jgi:hypothetical protein
MKLSLPNVTLVCISCKADLELSSMAVNDCMEVAEFGDVILFSDAAWKLPNTRYVECPPLTNVGAAATALWYALPAYIKTSHFLAVQWDSWIINPDLWTPRFAEYDYIGAPWSGGTVGNGGFSLRSTKLAKHVARNPDKYPGDSGGEVFASPHVGYSEDWTLSVTHRAALEADGFKWADAALAAKFSYELVTPDDFRSSFGFHGAFNWPEILSPEALTDRMVRVTRPEVRAVILSRRSSR